MSEMKINERIIEGIRENSEGDKAIESFLIDLIYEEADRPGHWWWKDTYKKKIAAYSADWSEGDED